MRKKKSEKIELLLIALFTTLLSFSFSPGCGPAEGTEGQLFMSSLRFDSDFPPAKQERIRSDFNYLKNLNFTSSASSLNLQKILKLPDLSSRSLLGWILTHVKILVSKDFDVEGSLSLDTQNTRLTGPENHSPQVIMSNIGSAVYIYSKQKGRIELMAIPGVGKITINSPLVGIIQEGKGLFGNSSGPDDTLSVLLRLATFFHEAWHEYGNDVAGTLGFPHVRCQSGDYHGKLACDRYLNGPYMLGALFIRSYLDTYLSHSSPDDDNLHQGHLDEAFQKTQLRLIYGDYLSRIQGNFDPKNTSSTLELSSELNKRLSNDLDPDVADTTPEATHQKGNDAWQSKIK